jgi:hypothetical protein
MRALLRLFALAALLAAAPAFATATSTQVELGGDGTIYRLWTGRFDEVFGPDNQALPGDTPVLALDIVPPGQALLRYVVPGTEGADTETSAALIYDRSSSGVHIVWNSRAVANLTTSRLHLRSLTPAGWSDLIELSGGSLSDKSALRLVLTADDYTATVEDGEARIGRRTLHLVWSENPAGTPRSYYSPVVFVRGRYLGWNPVVALDELADEEIASDVAVPVELRRAPRLVIRPDGNVSASFIHSRSNRLVSVDVQTLAGELGELADLARGHIVELASGVGGNDHGQLAGMARGHIVELARSFHPSAAAYFGDRTAELLASAEASLDGPALGEMARGHIVELSREFLKDGVASRCADEEVLLEIPPLDPADGPAFSHFFALRKVWSWEMPAEIAAPDAKVLVSSDGSRALVAWSGEGHLYYRETDAAGAWSEPRDLDLAHLALADAWDAIARRASAF